MKRHMQHATAFRGARATRPAVAARASSSTARGVVGVMVLAAAGALAGCQASTPPVPTPPTVPEVRPLRIVEEAHPDGPDAYLLVVQSCGADPAVSNIVESAEEVRVEVVATTEPHPNNECLDGVRLELDTPLGERQIVDMTSGDTIPVARYATEL